MGGAAPGAPPSKSALGQYTVKQFCFNHSKFAHYMALQVPKHSNSLNRSQLFTLGWIKLPLINSSSYSVSWTCSLGHSHPISIYFYWEFIISLTYFHSLTHPFIYTHNSLPNISISQSLTWSHCHSQERKEQFCWSFHVLRLKQEFYNYKLPVTCLCSPFHLLYIVTLSLPYYWGCNCRNSWMKLLKVTYAMDEGLKFINGCTRKI